MTNEQKAVKIATYDNWVKLSLDSDILSRELNRCTHQRPINALTKSYLTDLNYLVPVAGKVYKELQTIFTQGAAIVEKNIFITLVNEEKSKDGAYQRLFDAVHSAIVYLENQNA